MILFKVYNDFKLKNRINYLLDHHSVEEKVVAVNLINRLVTLEDTLDKYSPTRLVLVGSNMKYMNFPVFYRGLRKNASVHPYPVYGDVPFSIYETRDEYYVHKTREEWFDEFFVNTIVKNHIPEHITVEQEFPRVPPKPVNTTVKPIPKAVTLDHKQQLLKFG